MCPVLYFTKYVLTHIGAIDVTNERSMLFPGGSQYNQFMNIFNKFLHVNEEDFNAL